MTDPTVTLYIFIAAYAAGLLSPYLTSERRQVVAATSAYRPIALILILVHCAASFLTIIDARFGVMANAAYISSLILVAKELRDDQHANIKRAARFGFIWAVLLSSWLIAGRYALGATRDYAYLVILSALLADLVILIVATQEMARSRSLYLKHIVAAALVALVIMVSRLMQVYHQQSYTLGFGHESELLFVLRLLNAVSFFVLLSAVTNYHFQKLWNREHISRVETEQGMFQSLLALAHARDNETGNHIIRTKNYVRVLANNLKAKNWFPVADVDAHIEQLFDVAPLHDIGKVGIPDHILLKPGKLEPPEWEIMKTHALIGESVLRAALPQNMDADPQVQSPLKLAIEIAGAHHERWDGQGYPRGLVGDQIPKSARLMTVADIYDALTSARPYKKTWSHDEAVAEIKSLSGSKLDPDVVCAFLEEEAEFRAIAKRYCDG